METAQKVLSIANNNPADSDVAISPTTMPMELHALPGQTAKELLPTNKEERIQLALQFIKQQENVLANSHDEGNGIRKQKHSLRQIALYFQVPKSTLYDRLKNKTVNINRAHIQQMKLTPQLESQFLTKLNLLSRSYGNIPNLTQIKDVISANIGTVSLGKKWIHNFIKRHENAVIYGCLSGDNNITLGNFKSFKNNYDYLWECFVPLLQKKVKQQKEPFYFIVRTTLDNSSLSSVFNCFKASPDLNMEISTPAQVVILNDELMTKEERVRELSKVLISIYKQCELKCSLVLFEGFDDTYHLDLLECDTVVDKHKFLTLPWGKQIFHKPLFLQFQPILERFLHDEGFRVIQLPLEETSLDLSTMVQSLMQTMQTKFPQNQTLAVDVTVTNSSPRDDNSANIFEHTALSQLQSVIDVIDKNEAQLYRDLVDPGSKVILNDIFTRLRSLVPQ